MFVSCTPRYIEKYSEPLAQATYGVNDSLAKSRVDLAWYYSNEVTKLVAPPKNRIPIKAVYSHNGNGVKVKSTYTDQGQRVLIIPDSYKNDKVVVVDSAEYDALKKDSATAKQLADELKSKNEATALVDKQRKVDAQNQLKLIDNYNTAQKQIIKKDLAILWRDIIIVVLTTIIALYIAWRLKIFAAI